MDKTTFQDCAALIYVLWAVNFDANGKPNLDSINYALMCGSPPHGHSRSHLFGSWWLSTQCAETEPYPVDRAELDSLLPGLNRQTYSEGGPGWLSQFASRAVRDHVAQTISKFDPSERSNWTANGKPACAAIAAKLGVSPTLIMRSDIDALINECMPGFNRRAVYFRPG